MRWNEVRSSIRVYANAPITQATCFVLLVLPYFWISLNQVFGSHSVCPVEPQVTFTVLRFI